MSNVLPRAKFNAIVLRCMAILERHCFIPQARPEIDARFSEVFETHYAFFGDITPKIPTPSLRKSGLAQAQLDQITLECAIVFVQQGVQGVTYNESLNCIRAIIADILEAMGYENPEPLCGASQAGWGCYKLWEVLAQEEGLDAEKIAENRRWHKRHQAQYYEE